MPKMFEFDYHVLRESARHVNRDNNTAQITLTYEPKLDSTIPYDRNDPKIQFPLFIETQELWDMIKNTGADPLIDMIDAEVQRYRVEKEAFITSEGVPAPYPQLFPEVVEFLVDKQYNVITME